MIQFYFIFGIVFEEIIYKYFCGTCIYVICKRVFKKTPLNLSHIYASTEIAPLQYVFLAPRYMQGAPVRVPHSYSNKQDHVQMRNTLELLHELFKRGQQT